MARSLRRTGILARVPGSPLSRGRRWSSGSGLARMTEADQYTSISLRGLPLRGGAVGLDPALHFRLEVADQPLYRPDGAVGQCTDRVAFDLVGDFEQHV